jgi:hypothetical protein
MYPDSRTILCSYYKHASLPANRLIIAKEAAAEVKRIQQIKLPRNHNDNALIVVDEKHGLYPFHLAARSDVNLDVLFYFIWMLYSERFGSTTTTTARVATSWIVRIVNLLCFFLLTNCSTTANETTLSTIRLSTTRLQLVARPRQKI